MKANIASFLFLPILGLLVIYSFYKPVELVELKKIEDGLSGKVPKDHLNHHGKVREKHQFTDKNASPLQVISHPNTQHLSAYQVQNVLEQDLVSVTEKVSQVQQFLQRKLLKTDLKYPYVLTEETISNFDSHGNKVVRKVDMVADHMMVQMQEGMSVIEFEKQLQDSGWVIRKRVNDMGLFLIETRGELSLDNLKKSMEAIALDLSLEYVEPDYVYHPVATPRDSRFFKSWGLHNTGRKGLPGADIDAVRAWDIGTGSRDIKVAIIDGGVDYTHPDLSDNMWRNPGEIPGNRKDDDGNGYVDDIYGYDFRKEDPNPMDTHGHGTHCAGIAGAVGDNGRNSTGVSWKVSIVALRVSFTSSDVVPAIDYATSVGCVATSNSYGMSGYSKSVKNAIQRAYDQGVMFVAAAGNFGADSDQYPLYPSGYNLPNVISVGASNYYDEPWQYSNYGKEKVHVFAPGVEIYSTKLGGGTVEWSGTSMAAPHVASLFALFESVHPGLSVEKRRDHLFRSVDRLDSMADKCVSGGRINAYKMLMNDTEAPTPNPIGFSEAPEAIDSESITMTAAQAEDVFPVQYYFENLSFPDKSHDSGWMDSRTYVDTGLEAETTYQYRVRTRDLALQFNQGKWSTTMSATTTEPQKVIGESGRLILSQASADDWTLVNLSQSYDNPVVYVSCQTYNGAKEFGMRIKNIGHQQFRVQIDEWDYDDGKHVDEEVAYVVVEAGRHVLKDGRVFQAGVSKGHTDGQIVYPLPFRKKPIVFSQVVTINETKAVVPRVYQVSEYGFSVMLQGQESTPEHEPERVHWMAWENGQGSLDDIQQSAYLIEAVNHNWESSSFKESFPSKPSVFVAMQTMNEIDTASLRLKDIDTGSFQVRVEEERSLDMEIQHADETLAALCMESGVFRKFLLKNEPPEAYHAILEVYPGTTGEVTLTGADLEGDALTFQFISTAEKGDASLEGDRFIYTPHDYQSGQEVIEYTVSDGYNTSRKARITVKIIDHPSNQRPVASDIMVSTYRNRDIDFSVSAEDGDGDLLSFFIQTGPDYGQLSGNFPDFTYLPDPFFTGSDEIEFYVTDSLQKSVLHRISISCMEVDPTVTLGETGLIEVEQLRRLQTHQINLSRDYLDPVVIMSLASHQDLDPVTVKLLSASDNNFVFQLQEWEYQDGIHGEELVSYLVMEAGVHQLVDGTELQAGRAFVEHRGTLSFVESFSYLPMVAAQAMGNLQMKTVAIRQKSIALDGVTLRFQGQESDSYVSNLDVHWLAVSEAAGLSGDQSYEFVQLGRTVDSEWSRYDYTQTYLEQPIPFTSLISNYGSNTSTARMKEPVAHQVEIKIEEEQSLDQEVDHVKEELGLMIFEDGVIFGSTL